MEGTTLDSLSLAEHQEGNRRENAIFLGGLFSAGGRIAFNVENQTKEVAGVVRKYAYAYPIVTINNDEVTVRKLVDMFGGKKSGPDSKGYYRWYVKSNEAVDVSQYLKKSCPTREEVIAAFELWEHSALEDRLQIARECNAGDSKRNEQVSSDAYMELVKDPMFLAGVFTARGLLYRRPTHNEGFKPPILQLSSENKALLNALKSEYTGAMTNPTRKTVTLSFGYEVTERLLAKVKEYPIIPFTPKFVEEDAA